MRMAVKSRKNNNDNTRTSLFIPKNRIEKTGSYLCIYKILSSALNG